MKEQLIIYILFIMFSFSSCGKMGDPMPPDMVLSQYYSDLSVERAVNRVFLQWRIASNSHYQYGYVDISCNKENNYVKIK